MSERDELESAIANLESQRGILGDAAVDAAVAGVRMQLNALDAAARSQGQRKHVTVLFADVSSFTAMSETMDAEDVREIMNALWEEVDKIITDHGGQIDKHIGDAVMALWGSVVAKEDDPEQATRAALAMQTAVGSFAAAHNVPLRMRIGVNTGPVLLGEVGTTGEFTAMGDTVNTASRMEKAAPISGVLISQDTYRHVRGVFDVQAQEPLAVKGKGEPLQVYVVRRAKPRAFRMSSRGIEGIETQTIGRDQELGQLFAAYEEALRDSRTTAVTLVGEAGVGKSRLLYEFEHWLDLRHEEIRYLKGRATQQTRGIPQYLLRDMLATRFQILDSDSIATMREKFISGVAAYMPADAEMKAHVLGSWLGYDFSESPYLQPITDDPEQIKNRATLYLIQLMTAISLDMPAVMLLEDIHWADGGSLDALIDLARRAPALPLILVALARPSLYDRRPGWGEKLTNHTRLDLAPLADEESRALVSELLRLIDPLPEELPNLIASRAGGIPFYAEELVKMLVDDGVIVKSADHWHVAPKQFQELRIPATLTGVLQARLDKLQAAEKRGIQQASVIGRIFWDQALAVLSSMGQAALPALQAKEFIFARQNSAFAGTSEYIFKHSILWDVTYESVLKRHRRHYHGLVADWLVNAAEANGRVDEYASVIGDHFRLADDRQQAAAWYGRAGLQAAALFAHEEAVRYLSLALDFTEDDYHVDRFNLLHGREMVFDTQGNRERQKQDLEQLRKLAGRLGVVEQAQIALRQAHFAQVTGNYDDSAMYAQAAIELARRAGDKSLAAAGYWTWGSALWQQGRFADAERKVQLGLQLAEEMDDRKQVANCLNRLGTLAAEQNDVASAVVYFEQSLTICREIDDRWGEGRALHNLGTAWLGSPLADEYRKKALTIYREIGNRWGEENALNGLGFQAYHKGDYVAARVYFEQGLAISREIIDRRGETVILINLGHLAQLADANYSEAKQFYEQALELSRDTGTRWLEGISLHELGALALAQEQPAPAESFYQQASMIRSELNQPQYLFEDWAGLAKASMERNNRELGTRYVKRIIDYLSEAPQLESVENPMRAFRYTWEALIALGQDEEARQALQQAAQIIEEYLDQNNDPAVKEMYLSQPHHKVVWQTWLEQRNENRE